MNRLSVSWGAALTTITLLGCAGKAQDSSGANGGSGGDGPGGSGGKLSAICGASNGGEAGAVATGDACEGGAGGAAPVEQELLSASAWDVTVSAEYTERAGLNPVSSSWSFAIDGTDSPRAVFSAASEPVSTAALMRDSGTRAHLQLPETGIRLSTLTLQTLSLTAFDDDSDGIADRLEGSGAGAIDRPCADNCPPPLDPATFTLSGKRDQSPPKLQVLSGSRAESPPTILNPMNEVIVIVSEALKSATLTLEGTSTVPLDGRDDGVPPTGFSTLTVLPFGGTWQISGQGEDFAGLPLDLSAATVTTIDDPGILTQDGFETEPQASLGAGISRISASSGLPIPSGNYALFLPPREVARFHLRRTEGSTKVSLSVVGLSGARSEIPELSFNAAVIGGTARVGDLSPPIEVALTTNHETWTKASEPRTFQFALEDAGDDVAVEIRASGGSCGWPVPCSPDGALIIDDLRLE